MNVIVVFNGLGNQMSQYAFFLKKRKIDKATYIITNCKTHHGFELNKVFDINLDKNVFTVFLYIFYRILSIKKTRRISRHIINFFKLLNCNVIYENFDYAFNEDFLLSPKGINFYTGGWHNKKYFNDLSEDLYKLFEFKKPEDDCNIKIMNEIHSTNSISLHVRRGDYINVDNLNLFGKVCTKEYYDKAIETAVNKIYRPHFFVFSNDVGWVKQNLEINNVTYVTCNSGNTSWIDMYLMSICKHNIIANSTFSWWAAWLNKNKDKVVISPNRFLNSDVESDIYPDDWIKLSDY